MAALKPIALNALFAAAARALARVGWSRRRAAPAGTGPAVTPCVVALFPPLPEEPGGTSVGRRGGGNERPTLPPEAVFGFLGH